MKNIRSQYRLFCIFSISTFSCKSIYRKAKYIWKGDSYDEKSSCNKCHSGKSSPMSE